MFFVFSHCRWTWTAFYAQLFPTHSMGVGIVYGLLFTSHCTLFFTASSTHTLPYLCYQGNRWTLWQAMDIQSMIRSWCSSMTLNQLFQIWYNLVVNTWKGAIVLKMWKKAFCRLSLCLFYICIQMLSLLFAVHLRVSVQFSFLYLLPICESCLPAFDPFCVLLKYSAGLVRQLRKCLFNNLIWLLVVILLPFLFSYDFKAYDGMLWCSVFFWRCVCVAGLYVSVF